MRYIRILCWTVAVIVGLCGGACSSRKTTGESRQANPAIESAQKLPEGTNVIASLDQKDYEGAVSGLAKLQQAQLEGDQLAHFAILRAYIKDQLLEAGATDPKAVEALSALRLLTQGR